MKPPIRPEVLQALLAEVTQLQRAFRKVHRPVVVKLLLLPAMPIVWGVDAYLRLLQETYERFLGVRSETRGFVPKAFARYVAWGLYAKGWDVADDSMITSISRFVHGIYRVWLWGVVMWELGFSFVLWYVLITRVFERFW